MTILRDFVRSNPGQLAATVVLSCASAATTLLTLAQINRAATGVLALHGPTVLLAGLGWLSLLFAVSCAAQLMSARMGAKFVASLRSDLSHLFVEMSYEQLIHREKSMLGSFTQDVNQISVLISIFPAVIYNILVSIGACAYLFLLNSNLFIFLISGIILPLAVYAAGVRHFQGRVGALRDIEASLFDRVRTIYDAKKQLSLSRVRAEHFSLTQLGPSIDDAERVSREVNVKFGIVQSWMLSSSYAALVIVVLSGRTFLAAPASVIAQFAVASFVLLGALNALIATGQQLSRGWSSLSNLNRVEHRVLLQASMPVSEKPGRGYDVLEWRIIRAEGVVFRYPSQGPGEAGVGPINLEIHRGETLFFTGANGSGKSTLLLMLCGLLRPVCGQITVDDRAIDGVAEDYRRLFSGVFGDYHIFDHVLDDSGRPVGDPEGEQLLRKLDLKRDAVISDGRLARTALSTGQKKRLALLQCLVEDRGIYFFDEWTADQDPIFRRRFYEELLPEFRARGKTCLVISHDDRYFNLADRVIRLESGQATENQAGGTTAPAS